MMTQDDWQSIENAPKDGTDILLTDGVHIAVAWWDPESWPNADQGNACWSTSDWHNEPLHLRGGYAATHWMPLPPLPGFNPGLDLTARQEPLRWKRSVRIGKAVWDKPDEPRRLVEDNLPKR